MRIESIKAIELPPIKLFEASQLGDVVIIAGSNGSGKTRLKNAIIHAFQNPQKTNLDVTIRATRNEESTNWGTDEIELRTGTSNPIFQKYMETRTRGGSYHGSVIQIDSDRSVQPIKFNAISYLTPDPDDFEIDFRYFLNPFINRWQDLVNKIFQKVASRDNKIAKSVKENPDGTNANVLNLHPDPFIPYQRVFSKLLPGKTLESIDPSQLKEFHYRIGDSGPLPFNTLSSGEQEVIKIAFDLIWKRIQHCVILLDEPELHLHPTLTFRLIETLKDIGESTNQFFFFTHSADLISTYYASGNVFFINLENPDNNQAQRLNTLDENHIQIARALANNLGVFAVGKKLVFVEGEDASIDRITYHRISQIYFPEAYILPLGSVQNILALNHMSQELQRSIFGIDFFMVRDRDGLSQEQVNALEINPRFKCLRRRHIENYFLDEDILAKVAAKFYLDSDYQDKARINIRLMEIADSLVINAVLHSLKQFVTVNGALRTPRNAEIQQFAASDIKEEFASLVTDSLSVLSSDFSKEELYKKFDEEKKRFEDSFRNNTWKLIFPGKLIFAKYCGDIRQDSGRVRQAYLDIALMEKPSVFNEIQRIFEGFANV